MNIKKILGKGVKVVLWSVPISWMIYGASENICKWSAKSDGIFDCCEKMGKNNDVIWIAAAKQFRYACSALHDLWRKGL